MCCLFVLLTVRNDHLYISPPRTSLVHDLFGELPVGYDVLVALVHDGNAAQRLGHLIHHVFAGAVVGLDVGDLKNRLNKAGELHGVGREDGLSVAADEGGTVDQMPEAVSVNHKGDVGSFYLERNGGERNFS